MVVQIPTSSPCAHSHSHISLTATLCLQVWWVLEPEVLHGPGALQVQPGEPRPQPHRAPGALGCAPGGDSRVGWAFRSSRGAGDKDGRGPTSNMPPCCCCCCRRRYRSRSFRAWPTCIAAGSSTGEVEEGRVEGMGNDRIDGRGRNRLNGLQCHGLAPSSLPWRPSHLRHSSLHVPLPPGI